MKKLLIILLLIPINVHALSTTVMELNTKRTIISQNENEIRSVASISKIMTAILAIESKKYNKTITVKDYIKQAYGSGIYIKENEKIKISDLVYGLLLRSGNDAALAIANNISKNEEEFVKLMNKKAKKLKMYNTTFNNPSGLDENGGNMSTSHDMAILMSYCMQNKTFRKITKTKVHKIKTNMNNYVWINKNKLLKNYKYTTGGKTGYTKIAKRTLITTAKKGKTEFVIVTLNDGNDFQNHKEYYERFFPKYKTYKILKKGRIDIPNEEFYFNKYFYIKNDFYYTLTKFEDITIKYVLKEKYKTKKNEKIGKVEVYLDDKKIYTTNLYIGENG